MPTINIPYLNENERICLIMADTAYEGIAGAYGIGSLDPASFWHLERKKRDRLYDFGILSWTAKIPEHAGDHIGWYTLTESGREIARRINTLKVIHGTIYKE